jgi:hypothetical protein
MSARPGSSVRMSLLPTPECCWMARGWLARTRRPWFGWRDLKGALGSGSEVGVHPCHAHRPVTKISARVRQNRTWAVEDRGLDHRAVKPEHGSTLTKVERNA